MRRAAITLGIFLLGILTILALPGAVYYNEVLRSDGGAFADRFERAIVDRGCEVMSGPSEIVTMGNHGVVLRCPRIHLP